MAFSEAVVLRVRTSAGHSRVSVSAACSLTQLYAQIAEHLHIPEENQTLSLDQQGTQVVPRDSTCTVQSFGLATGSILHVSCEGCTAHIRATTSTVSTAEPTKSDAAPEHPSQSGTEVVGSSSSSSRKISNPSVTTPEANASPGDPKNLANRNDPNAQSKNAGSSFKPFDSFIRERMFGVLDLPLMMSYAPRTIKPGQMNKLPPSVTLKHQVYRHLDHLELMQVDEVKNFVNFWRNDLQMQQQRFAWIFGYYVEDAHYPEGIRAVCEFLYEPPQEGQADRFKLLPDEGGLEAVERLCKRLGLELIGLLFTHPPREELLTSEEVVFVAQLQLKYLHTTHFTGYPAPKLAICTICMQNNSEEEEPNVVPNAFMVSDMAIALVRDGVIATEQPDPIHIMLRESEKGEVLPQILEGGRETKRFDASWFIVRVNESAPKKVRSFFKHVIFPRENRFIDPTPQDIRMYFEKVDRDCVGSARFSDMHMILYVCKLFDEATALSICEALVDNTPVDNGLEEILKSLG